MESHSKLKRTENKMEGDVDSLAKAIDRLADALGNMEFSQSMIEIDPEDPSNQYALYGDPNAQFRRRRSDNRSIEDQVRIMRDQLHGVMCSAWERSDMRTRRRFLKSLYAWISEFDDTGELVKSFAVAKPSK